MPRKSRQRRKRARAKRQGLAPGTPTYALDAPDVDSTVSIARWSAAGVETLFWPTDVTARDTVTWIDCADIRDADMVREITERAGVHALWTEDLLNPSSRAKTEIHGRSCLVILRRFVPDSGLNTEQVGLVLVPGAVLTFREADLPIWDVVRARINDPATRLRTEGADYLLHALMDAVIDESFVVLDTLENELDALEMRGLQGDSSIPEQVLEMKIALEETRQIVRSTQEAFVALRHSDGIFSDKTVPYLTDLIDHQLQIGDMLDTARSRLLSVIDIQVAITSQRMNSSMRLLAVVSTVFIPLSFVAGVFGMNFDHLPGQHTPWGFPLLMVGMGILAVGMILAFQRLGWLR